MLKIKICTILWFLQCASVLFAQDPLYRKLDFSNGLPSNEAYDLYQDKKGYMWVGHARGISKYTGYIWKTYTHKDMTSYGLSYICEDSFGTIWCTNFNGQVFYIKNDSIQLFKKFNTINVLSFSELFIVDDKVYIQEKKAVFVYDIRKDSVKRYFIDNKEISKLFAYKNTVYAGVGDVVYQFKNGTFIKSQFTNVEIDKIVKKRGVRATGLSMIALPDNEMLTYDKFNDFLVKFDKTGKYQLLNIIPNPIITTTVNIIDKDIYLNTYTGYYRINQQGKLLEHLLPNFVICDELYDREGNFWLSTLKNGIIIIPNKQVVSKPINTDQVITAIHLVKEQQKLFLGTERGEIICCDLKTLEPIKKIKVPKVKDVEMIVYDSKRNSIIVSAAALYRINLVTYRIEELKGGGSIKSVVSYKDAYFTASKIGVWGASTNIKQDTCFLDKYWRKRYSFEKRYFTQKKNNKIVNITDYSLVITTGKQRTYSLAYDSLSDCIYASAKDNLYRFNSNEVKEVKYKSQAIKGRKIVYHYGKTYIASINHGIYRVDQKGQVTCMDENKAIRSITDFSCIKNYLFGICDSGILKLNLTTLKVEVFTEGDGFARYKYQNIAATDSDIILSDGHSITRLPITVSSYNKIPVQFYLRKVLVNGMVKQKNELLELNHSENNVEIQYDLLSYRSMSNIKVFYRIVDGATGSWIAMPPEENALQIPSLAPGNYKIEFKAYNNSGVLMQTPVVDLLIRPPFWQTWWFILLLILLTAAVILFFNFLRLKRIRYQNQLILDKVTLEKDLRQSILTSIRSQMNPHFVFNALNTIHSYIYTSDKSTASDYLIKFSDLTRSVLEMSNKESISLKEELDALELYLYLENARLDGELNYTIYVEEAVNKEVIHIPPMMIQPYVENAVKHGLLHLKEREKIISIDFQLHENVLKITITDNGIGREKSAIINQKRKKHNSFASDANQKRLEIINQERSNKKIGLIITDLYDKHQAIGTQVVLEITI